MAKPVLNEPQFLTEDGAFAYVEARLWPSGPVCPHCGETKRIGRLSGKTTRPGLHKCYACKKPFTVRMGTLFEDSHLPLHLWLQVIHLFCCSKKGIATRQIQRMLNCSMKTAWFLGHRIRLAMDPGSDTPMGGEGKTVEIDDMELGRSHKTRRRPEGRKGNVKVLSLIERGGPIRSIVLDHRGIGPRLYKHLDKRSRLVSDSAPVFKFTGAAKHEAVDHSKFEWVRGDVHTNTLEGFFSIFKRGIIGVYQHVDSRHFDRYLAEFDFRQNTRAKLGYNDADRADVALKGVKGKRLTYERTLGA
ncbi:MAG TPA: IS1595 family transposase [Xanthobacteraceae bacterium]|nr:IS1595 family transposase [Xanthobacteraceae bacterium]